MSEIIVKLTDSRIKLKGGEYVRDLVRCKDCEHRFYDGSRDLLYCEMFHGLGSVYDENFCSYGERAEE